LAGATDAPSLPQGDVRRGGFGLAGATDAPSLPQGDVRRGGFGGWEGLAAHLREDRVDMLIDATHPFASAISANARRACDMEGVPRLMLIRPMWERQPGDDWREVHTPEEAADLAEALARPLLLTTGVKTLDAYRSLTGPIYVRLLKPPARPLPENFTLLAHGPLSPQDELAFFKAHAIAGLVSKASGGEKGYGKIAAARALGIPVVMLRRPAPEPGEHAATVAQAVAWARSQSF
ncbi:MAG: hypothetical protein A2516_05720, partial [Alphaproteobacteria bacterium RIFOXYD12_FULL_60_8]